VLALAGCGGGSGDEPAATTTAPAQALPRGLAAPVTLRRTYPFGGRPRAVDTEVVPGTLLDPWRNPAVPVPAGARLVAVQMTWLDRGRDPFPREWARFAARDDRGAKARGTFLGPERRSGRLTIQPVGFIVDRGRRLATVGMTSIVDVWPFRASWRLRGN
jgi:hypothetical protein